MDIVIKNGPIPASFFVYFRSFLVTISIKIEKSIDGVLGIRTRCCRMVGADETTELWILLWTLIRYGSDQSDRLFYCFAIFATSQIL